jgi:cysteine desulfurase/selenocysteine lyase
MEKIFHHEVELGAYLIKRLSTIEGLRIIGPQHMQARGGTVSFTFGDIHPHDLGQYLDAQGIAVRTGHHCAWPLTRKLGVAATTRASLYFYNDESDVDALVDGIIGAKKYFGRS